MISYNYLDYYFMVTWTTINPISEMRKQHDQVMKGRAYSAFLVRYLYMILCTFPNIDAFPVSQMSFPSLIYLEIAFSSQKA